MKEKYIKPNVEMEKFKTVDVITTRGDILPDDNNVDGSDGW